VKLNYWDDRKEKKLRDEMDRQRRQAVALITERQEHEHNESLTRSMDWNTSSTSGDDVVHDTDLGVSDEEMSVSGDHSEERDDARLTDETRNQV
jgi:hypothetical protein